MIPWLRELGRSLLDLEHSSSRSSLVEVLIRGKGGSPVKLEHTVPISAWSGLIIPSPGAVTIVFLVF